MLQKPIDPVNDLWTIFECPIDGVLFFSEDMLDAHLKREHYLEYKNTKCFSVELIRAIPQSDDPSNTDGVEGK